MTQLFGGKIDIINIFQLIILVFGAYSMYVAKDMKTTKKPPEWLLPPSQITIMKNPKGFCEVMSKKTMILGLVCVLFGIFGVVSILVPINQVIKIIAIIIFLIVAMWYFKALQDAKNEFV